MKWLFAIFLIANLIVFGLAQLDDSATLNVRIDREKNADRVKVVTGITPTSAPTHPATTMADAASEPLLTEETASSVVAATPTPTSAPTPTRVKPSAPNTVSASAASAATLNSSVGACLRWSGFSIEQAKVARSRISSLGLTATEKGGAEGAKVWVYIPPQPSLERAKSKAQEVVDLGVEDYFVVNNGGKWQNAISLGIYSSHEAAERRLAELKSKGVRSAQVRDKDDTLKPLMFLLRGVNDSARSQLEALSKRYRGIEIREMACP